MIELLMTSLISMAATDNPLLTVEEKQIQERARKREYPGGRDEENLKVQPQLSFAIRKMSPVTDSTQSQTSESGED